MYSYVIVIHVLGLERRHTRCHVLCGDMLQDPSDLQLMVSFLYLKCLIMPIYCRYSDPCSASTGTSRLVSNAEFAEFAGLAETPVLRCMDNSVSIASTLLVLRSVVILRI